MLCGGRFFLSEYIFLSFSKQIIIIFVHQNGLYIVEKQMLIF